MNAKAQDIINKLSEIKDDETSVECFLKAAYCFCDDNCQECIDEVLKALEIAVKHVTEKNASKFAEKILLIINIANKYIDENTLTHLFKLTEGILDRFQKWNARNRENFDRTRMSIMGCKDIDEALRFFECSYLEPKFKSKKAEESYKNLVSEQTELKWRKSFLDYQLKPETKTGKFHYLVTYELIIHYFRDVEYIEKFYLKMSDYRNCIRKVFWDDALKYVSRMFDKLYKAGNFELFKKYISLAETMIGDIDKDAESRYLEKTLLYYGYSDKPLARERVLENIYSYRCKFYRMTLPKKIFTYYELVENETDAKWFYRHKENYYESSSFDPREFDYEAHEKMIESYDKHSSPELEKKWEQEFYEENIAKIKSGEPYNIFYLSESKGAERTPKDERFLDAAQIVADDIKGLYDTKSLIDILLPDDIYKHKSEELKRKIFNDKKNLFIKCLEFAEHLIEINFHGISDDVEYKNLVKKKRFSITGVKSYEEARELYCISDMRPHFFTDDAERSYMRFADELQWRQNIFNEKIISDERIKLTDINHLFYLFGEIPCTPDNVGKLYSWIENKVPLREYDRTAEGIVSMIIPDLKEKSLKEKFLNLAENILNKYIETYSSGGYKDRIYRKIEECRKQL